MDKRALFLCLLAIACAPAGAAVVDRTDHAPRLLTVSGTATLDLEPDCLDVRMVIAVEKPGARDAVAGLRARQDKLVKALLAAGLQGSDLRMSQLSLAPYYDAEGKRMLGYRAALDLTASTREFDRAGDIIEIAAGAGATELTTSARRSDIVEQKVRVRAMALEAAKAKAAQSAEVLGVRLAGVAAINEAGEGGWGEGGVANAYNAMERSGTALGPSSAPLTLTVTVSYELS